MGTWNSIHQTGNLFEPASLNQFFDTFPKGVVFTDTSNHIQYLNHAAELMLGLESNQLKGCPIQHVFSDALPIHCLNGERHHGFSFKSSLVATGHRRTAVEVSYSQIQDGQRHMGFFMLDDISELVNSQRRLYQQSITDQLTGLFNRRYFDERLAQEFGRASRYRRLFSVIILDIDGFKQANDLYGHGYGDQMLRLATEIFKETFRDEDTLYRYGGDEFAMILPETTKEGAIEVAERLRDCFARRCCERSRRIKLSLSVGVASHPEDGHDAKGLVGVADRRMYQAKESGGNRINAYDGLMHSNNEVDHLLQSLTSLVQMMEKSRGFSSVEGIGHSQEMRSLGVEIGRRLGLPTQRLQIFEQAAMLHDIGTIHLPNELLQKRGKLNESEWQQIKLHTTIGEEILGMLVTPDRKDLADLQRIVAQHHESVDGSGYPRGLTEREILLEAKILAVTDAYSAMLTDRPYRPALERDQALAELVALSGKRFAPEVVTELLALEFYEDNAEVMKG